MENRLGALETLSVMTENGKADADIVEALWRSALYCMGHDQITAEHVDIVYRDIEEKVSDFRAGEKKLLDFFSGKATALPYATHFPKDITAWLPCPAGRARSKG